MQSETHEHFDAKGILTGRTVVTREPEWDDYARERALSLLVWEAGRCPACGNYDTVIIDDPADLGPAMVTWPDGRSIQVQQMRCLACGAVDAVKRDWMKAHEKDQTFPGQALPADGRMFVGRPATEEDLDG